MAEPARLTIRPFLIQDGLPKDAYLAAKELRRELDLSWRQVTALAFLLIREVWESQTLNGQDFLRRLADTVKETVDINRAGALTPKGNPSPKEVV